MTSARKKQSISEQINDALKAKDLTEENDEVEARVEEFTEHGEKSNRVSDIRRQTARSLSELDSKYKGKAVTRKELEADDNDDDLSDLESSEDEELEQPDSESDDDEGGSAMGSDQEDSAEDEEGSEQSGSELEGSDQSGSEDEFDDDFDISQFAKPAAGTSSSSRADEKTELLKKASLVEEIQKGLSVKNQLKIWEKLLEVRIKSQKMLITANSLPDYDAHLELASSDDATFTEKVERTCDGLHGLLDNLLELQSTMINRFPETKTLVAKRKVSKNGSGGLMKKSKLSEYADQLEETHSAYTNYRNPVLQKWNERTKTAKDLKNPAANLDIVTKIDNALLRKKDLIQKTQTYRGDFEICGVEMPEPDANGVVAEQVLPEIFDDSEFYHQLLRELIEYKSNVDENQAEITQKFIELQKVRSRMKKKVDTRASKGRKIRYIVHNKLVNFMPPRDDSEWTDEAKNELFSSLFGMLNQGKVE